MASLIFWLREYVVDDNMREYGKKIKLLNLGFVFGTLVENFLWSCVQKF